MIDNGLILSDEDLLLQSLCIRNKKSPNFTVHCKVVRGADLLFKSLPTLPTLLAPYVASEVFCARLSPTTAAASGLILTNGRVRGKALSKS